MPLDSVDAGSGFNGEGGLAGGMVAGGLDGEEASATTGSSEEMKRGHQLVEASLMESWGSMKRGP